MKYSRRVAALVLLATLAWAAPTAAQTTTVNFDTPTPPGSSFSLVNGAFQGIDFGIGQWRWESAYNVDATNHIFFDSSAGTSRTFRFSPAPRLLTSMRVFTTGAGTLTLSDDLGQTITRAVATGSMQLVTTGWTLPSTVITVTFSSGWNLGIDDVTYSVAGGGDTIGPTVSLTSPVDGGVVTGTVSVSAQASDNVGVAGVQFLLDGAPLGPESTVPPYATSWNTATATNGMHTLTAVARDAATNQTTSAPVRVSVANPAAGSGGAGYALRFHGNGVNDIDRVKILIDDPATTAPGPPADVGATDFTLEFWFRALATENRAPAVACGANNNWINGNVVVDRDRFNQGRAFGLSLAGGVVVFGVLGDGTGALTICGTTNVLDNQWHHVAVQRRRADGWLWLYVDGRLEAQGDGPDGDVSYPDDGVPGNFCGGLPCTNSDPYLVLGAEKHDAGAQFPSFAGWLDEFRLSNVLRYATSFTRPTAPFLPDANTVALYHFDEGSGDVIIDTPGVSGGPSHGVRRFGGSPAGPEWVISDAPLTSGPAQTGQWTSPFAWPIVTVHMMLSPTGQVLAWDNSGGSARVWNPATATFTQVPNGSNLYCSGHASLPDGRTLVVGGFVSGFVGISDVNVFDPMTQSWTASTPMSFPRWYPTATTLPDGRVLVTSGTTTCETCIVEIPEVFDPATNTWTQLTNARLSVPVYPFMFVLPDGRVLNAGAEEVSVATSALDVQAQTWTMIDPVPVGGGSAAMYLPGRVVKSGAVAFDPSNRALDSTWVIDMTQPSPAWRATAPMAFPRSHHNLTILPDGAVLVVGGGRTTDGVDLTQAVYEAELWWPETETWSTMARMQVPRLYHSTALLLPDGRVLVAGGGRFGPDQFSAEIYSPPYLFRGVRPTITLAPSGVGYGTNFQVTTPDASNIAMVSLARLGAVTHSFNQDQRYLALGFQPGAGGLTVQAPANANLAPPGYYMLFVINGAGVPSVAAFVRLSGAGTDATTPTVTITSPTTNTTYTTGSASLALGGTAADDVGVTQVTWANDRGGAGTAAGTTTWTVGAIALQPGVNVLTVTALDATGRTGTDTLTVTYTPPDTTPPTVAITSPTTNSTYSTATSPLALAGTTADNVGVTQVTWTNDRGGSGTATGTASWTVGAIALQAGTNVLTVTARDAAGNSGTATLTVTYTPPANPVPSTTGLSPATAPAGGAGFTLTVNGSNFVTGAVVRWNGANRTTTFVSATQLTAAIAAADIVTGGTAQVTVFNPTPGGGVSNAQTFTISTSVTTTTVTFDNPVPAGSSGSFLNGLFQGLSFGTSQWRWENAFGADPTRHIYFASSTGTSRAFTFSPGPRTLVSMRVFTGVAGTLTLTDNLGQTRTQSIATGSMQLVTTGWTQASTTVTVSFTAGWELGVDDIVYRSP